MRWALRSENVTSALIGARTVAQDGEAESALTGALLFPLSATSADELRRTAGSERGVMLRARVVNAVGAVVKLAEGFNGADMRNICTEAGMMAIRADRDYVVEEDFMKAVRKIQETKKYETKLDYSKV